MTKVRIYDLSRELDLENKQVLDICNKLNITAKTHSSIITKEDAECIREYAGVSNPLNHKNSNESANSLQLKSPPRCPEAKGGFDHNVNFAFRQKVTDTKSWFIPITSILPFQLKPTPLTKLAAEIGKNHKFSPPELPPEVNQYQTCPPRSLDKIFMDLEQENAENISLLEWVYCIYYKKEWDQKHSKDQQLSTSRLIWESAIDNDAIKQRLCWRLAYYYDGYRDSLAPSLVETFSTLSDIHNDNLAVKILCTLQKRDQVLAVSKLSLRKELIPKELFKTAQLPTNLSVINDALEYVATVFSEQSNPTQEEASWLLNCFKEMTIAQEVSAVETLLKSVSAEVGGQFQNLVQWLQNNYGSRVTASKWDRLSSEAKSALRQWFGAANYRDFQKLVEIILKRLPLQDWEKNQLDSRKCRDIEQLEREAKREFP